MRSVIELLLVWVVWAGVISTFAAHHAPHHKVLLVLVDGLRWDADLPALKRLSVSGVQAERLIPCFPTDSFPNYNCITTGLYSESHGMVGNRMYDAEDGDSFKIDLTWPDDSKPKWWDGGEPIWVTALKQGRRVKLYNWPGCEMAIRGVKLSEEQCIPYVYHGTDIQLGSSVHSALHLLAQDQVDFLGIYEEQPDHIQHMYGLGSSQTAAVLQVLNQALTLLQDLASNLTLVGTSTPLSDVLDVIVVSDHGHIPIEIGDADLINVTAVLDMDDVTHVLTAGAIFSVWPKEGRADAVYSALSQLPHSSVYWKKDMPESWHYKQNHLVAPIITVSDPGYQRVTPDHPDQHTYPVGSSPSTHGYDPTNITDLDGIFYATGPNFRPGMATGVLENVNLYQIMCAALGLDAAPNNGSWNNVKEFLQGLVEPAVSPATRVSYNNVFTFLIFLYLGCEMAKRI